MIENLLQGWRGLRGREQRMVVAAFAFVLLAFVYLVLFEPAWKGVNKLGRELGPLRAQAAQMSALAAEARKLSAAPKAAESVQVLQAALGASVRAAGFGESLTRLELSGELFELQFSAVPHAAWLAWLDTTLRETGLRVADLSIDRAQQPGIVAARLVLEAPKAALR